MDAVFKRILVTGAQGFVGRYLVSWCAQADPSVQILGIGRSPQIADTFTHRVQWGAEILRAPLPLALRQRGAHVKYVAADLGNRRVIARLLDDFQPEVVFHVASALHHDPPDALFQTNIMGTAALLEALAQSRCRVRLAVIVSTGGVYGGVDEALMPIREDAPCLPMDLYAGSKLAAEYTSRVLAAQHHLPVVVARVFNIVGPGQDERHVCGRIASQVAAIMRRRAEPVVTVEDLLTTRDFIDARDVARALAAIGTRGAAGSTVNVGSGQETTIGTVLQTFLRLADLEGRVTVRARDHAHVPVRRQQADVTALADLGFRCDYALRRSCHDLLMYYLTDVADRARPIVNTSVSA